MSRIRGKDTEPELVVRRLLRGLGYRYRLHYRALPGSPDLVFLGRRKVIFVHGCFWHRHKGCVLTAIPKTRKQFWQSKFDANVERDRATLRQLRIMGWKALVIWECETKKPTGLERKLIRFLEKK